MPIASERFPFAAIMIALVPEERGVYVLWQEDELIYVGRALGRSMTVRSRLIDHFTGLDGPCTQRATHYGWELSRRPGERELQLLEEYRAERNRLPRCNRV